MHFGHTTTATLTRQCRLLLRNSLRLALLGILFAMTCWEVNPGQMPMPQSDQVRVETPVIVAEGRAGRSK